MSLLESLKKYGSVLADTGDTEAIAPRRLQAGVTLSSPFGRITTGTKSKTEAPRLPPTRTRASHPSHAFTGTTKKYGRKTQAVGAGSRNVNEIVRLAGADLLIISHEGPDQLEQTWASSPASSNGKGEGVHEKTASSRRQDLPLDAQRKCRWRRKNWLKRCANSTLTPAICKNARCPRLPRGSRNT